MGYRSDVRALIYPVSSEHSLIEYDKLKLLMNTTFKDVFDSLVDNFYWNDTHRALEFTATSIKWYDSYPEVAKFVKFLEDVRDLEYEYEFIRIGEDTDDIEDDSTGDAHGFLYVSRSIEVAF